MMDRRVKERLVGATILVALIVLVVPELLSGPKPSSAPPLEQGLPATTREVNVDLATSQATPEPQGAPASSAGAQAASSGAEAQEPRTPGGAADGAASPPAGNELLPPTVATLRAQGSPPALETAPPVPKSAAHATSLAGTSAPAVSKSPAPPAAAPERRSAWAVQLGSFASRVNADKLVRQLQVSAAGSAYVLSSGAGPSLRYRVRMGPLADRASAERAVVKLKAQGHPATVVTPSS
jgi:DedD protein